MPIQLIGTATQASNLAAVSLTIAKPAGPLVNGDYLIAHLRAQASNSTADWSLAGWLRAPTPAFVPTNGARVSTFLYRLVTDQASEPASYTFGGLNGGNQRVAGSLFILRGVNPSVAFVGCGGVYGGVALTNGKRVAAYTVPNPATVIYAGDTERASPNPTRPDVLPAGYTEVDFVTANGTATNVSRTTAWTGMRDVVGGTVADADTTWFEASPPGPNATSFAVMAIPGVAAAFGDKALFTANVALVPATVATFGQKATFTAMTSKPGSIPAATPKFGQAAVFTALVRAPLPTPPSLSNEIGCTVLIDGVPINDGCVSTDPFVPTVLSGLKIEWGRSSTVDQPQASTCTFQIIDPLVEPRIVPSLTIGRRVDVRVDTIVYLDPDISLVPHFYPSWIEHALSVVVNPPDVMTVVSDGSGQRTVVLLPPLPLSGNPFAWDAVPRTLPGQEWHFQGTVTFPVPFAGYSGWAAQLRPVAFVNPSGAGAHNLSPDPAATLTPANPTCDVYFVPEPGVWLGMQYTVAPTSPRWVDLDNTSWSSLGAHPTWDELGTTKLSGMKLLAPSQGTAESAFVFSGRITDVLATWDGTIDSEIQVIAQDWRAELANRNVGDQPWASESLNARAQRIVQLSGQPMTLNVDAGVANLPVSYRDVDRQPALDLLQQLANSCGGVLWAATHIVTGQFMNIEDVNTRPAALTLSDAGGLVHVVVSATATANAMPITACDIDLEPVQFILDMTDTLSMIAVQWMDQTVNTEGKLAPTQRTVEVTSPETMAAIGARRMSVSTQLTQQTDATAQANQWLARSSTLAWRVEGLRWTTSDDRLGPDDIATAMNLLDGIKRNGLPIALTDLPPWTDPMTGNQDAVALYLEGGTYTYDAGSWVLVIKTSSATGSAIGDTSWNDLDADWLWTTFDPGVSWLDLYGVTYPEV